jgi:hypothetical protein
MAERKDLFEVLAIALLPFVAAIVIPLFAMYGLGGAQNEKNLVKFFLYGVILYGTVIATTVIKVLDSQGWFEDHPDLKPFARMTVHSPRNSILVQQFQKLGRPGKAIANTIIRPTRLIFVFGLIALAFGSIVAITGTFVSGVPTLVEGQVTETAQLSLAVEPAVMAETLFFNTFMFYIIVAAVAWLLMTRLGLDLLYSIIVGKVVAVILNTPLFMLYHFFRYQGSEASLVGVGFLGLLTNVLTALTDSIIPAYLLHGSGNFFQKLQTLGVFTNELMIVAVLGVAITFTIGWNLLFDPFQVIWRDKVGG